MEEEDESEYDESSDDDESNAHSGSYTPGSTGASSSQLGVSPFRSPRPLVDYSDDSSDSDSDGGVEEVEELVQPLVEAEGWPGINC